MLVGIARGVATLRPRLRARLGRRSDQDLDGAHLNVGDETVEGLELAVGPSRNSKLAADSFEDGETDPEFLGSVFTGHPKAL